MHSTNYLYKYQPINKYSINTIVNSYIYLSSPLDFNDPFDCYFNLVCEGKDNELLKFFCERDIKYPEILLKEYKTLRPKAKENFLKDIIRSSIDTLGIYCFSEVNDNIQMFSHYADSHKGICLQFKKQDLFEKAESINYLHDNLTRTVNIIIDYEPKDFLLGKSCFWEYEKEWRLLHQYKKGQEKIRLLNFDPTLLSGIIFGCRISDPDKDLITSLITGRQVKLYQAEMNKNSYKLEIKESDWQLK